MDLSLEGSAKKIFLPLIKVLFPFFNSESNTDACTNHDSFYRFFNKGSGKF